MADQGSRAHLVREGMQKKLRLFKKELAGGITSAVPLLLAARSLV